jgi:PAS domain S-box-containing protein
MFWKKKEEKKEIINAQIKDIAIADYFTDGLLIFDQANRLVLMNPQAEKFFEVRESDALGKSIIHLSKFKNVGPLVSFLGGGIKQVNKKDVEMRDNFILQVTSVPIIDNGERISVLVILRDVTKERLSDKMKSEFVTLAAHQLRTPTSAVKWSLLALSTGDLGTLNEEQKKAVETAYITNDKVIGLVKDLLDLAQIEGGRFLSNMELCDIEEIIESMIKEDELIIENRKLNVEFQKSEYPLPKLMLDKEKIKIAIENIFDNALRYTLAGGKITITCIGSKKEVEIQIKDTGLGIPADEQNRVFTKFFRSNNVMRRETEGTGLGLYISKNIIEAHEGRIWFDSELNKGTTFYFTIPIKEQFGEYLSNKFY